MDNNSDRTSPSHSLLLSSLTKCQCGLIKGHIINIDNRFNKVFPSFNSINPKFQSGNRIIDNFSNCVSFHLFSKCNNCTFEKCIQQLNTLVIEFFNSPTNALIIIDVSIKNNIAVSIAYIYIHNKPMVKILHHTINVTSSKAKLFDIRCGIIQAVCSHEISKIIIVTDSIHTAKKIFNLSLYMLQKQATLILKDLREFFNCHYENIIKFWECLSKSNWKLHKVVDTEMKSFNLAPLIPNKNFWDFSRKSECDDIINKWKMMFQASNLKGNNFLDLVNSDDKILEPTYSKGSIWLQHFGHSNTLCARATRVIMNHAPIEEYWLRFFPNKEFSCLCSLYYIELRQHILYECRRFNKY